MEITLKSVLKRMGFQNLDWICRRIGTSGRLLFEQLSTFWSLKLQGSSRLDEQPLGSQGVSCSMESANREDIT